MACQDRLGTNTRTNIPNHDGRRVSHRHVVPHAPPPPVAAKRGGSLGLHDLVGRSASAAAVASSVGAVHPCCPPQLLLLLRLRRRTSRRCCCCTAAAGFVRRRLDGVRLLGTGELKAKLDITVTGASKGAIEAVEKAGGKVTVTGAKTAKAAE